MFNLFNLGTMDISDQSQPRISIRHAATLISRICFCLLLLIGLVNYGALRYEARSRFYLLNYIFIYFISMDHEVYILLRMPQNMCMMCVGRPHIQLCSPQRMEVDIWMFGMQMKILRCVANTYIIYI